MTRKRTQSLPSLEDGTFSGDLPSHPQSAVDSEQREAAKHLRSDGTQEPWGDVGSDTNPILRALEGEPSTLCALLMLRHALLAEPEFL